jgi:predicted NUDIX family NTP pyrophosphohydrolase
MWYLSNKDFLCWDAKAACFKIDWDARAALVPLALWRNIPEADRKNWDTLDQSARDKLIEDARKKP